MAQTVFVYQSLARAIHDHGTTPVHGLMDDANLFLVRSFVHERGAEFIAATHEASSVVMTSAFAVHPAAQDKTASGCINCVSALDRLDAALPPDRLLVTDEGRFMTKVWCRISVPDPDSFVRTVYFGSIGLGLPQGIGAGLAPPERPVVLVSGGRD